MVLESQETTKKSKKFSGKIWKWAVIAVLILAGLLSVWGGYCALKRRRKSKGRIENLELNFGQRAARGSSVSNPSKSELSSSVDGDGLRVSENSSEIVDVDLKEGE